MEKIIDVKPEKKPEPGTCGACVFFEPDERRKGEEGECRESPPKVHMLPVQTMQGNTIAPVSVWPRVAATAWCGDCTDQTEAPPVH